MSWIEESGPFDDLVVSSRIRLARNIASFPFPILMDSNAAERIMAKVCETLASANSQMSVEFDNIRLRDLSQVKRKMLVERHVSSPELAKNPEFSMLIKDKKERICIMVNEEDHLRLQCLCSGLQLTEAWKLISNVDDLLEESIDYAYDEQIGYLTSCPTNVGTGLRASVMIHLVALRFNKQIDSMFQAISKVGLTARGLYGEGSEASGDLYQISNQISLGSSEEEIINNLSIVVNQLMEKERKAREALILADKAEMEDRIWRNIATIKYARKLGLKEFMDNISYLRLGVSLGIVRGIDSAAINFLMIEGQNGHVKSYAEKELTQPDLDIARASIIRDRFKIMEII